ncbi:unnamed protein product [Sympodiomycopsis kandeliae]
MSQNGVSAEAGPSRTREVVTDPLKALQEKRKLREDYHLLVEQLAESADNLAGATPEDVHKYIASSDQLMSHIKAPREAVLDAQVLTGVTDLGMKLTKSMRTHSSGFDIDEYISRVAKFIGGTVRTAAGGRANGSNKKRKSAAKRHADHVAEHDSDEDADDHEQIDQLDMQSWNWQRLGLIASKYSRKAPTMDHLVGPLAVEPRERKVVKRAKLAEGGEAVRPEELEQKDLQQNENETSRCVHDIAKRLQDKGGDEGINLFEFVLNPKSFSNSVENLFYVSFLVKEGIAAINDDDEGGPPMIIRVEPPSEEDYEQGLKKRQIVLELDKATWRDLIETYNIKESVIPTRRAASALRTGRWYG